ncbi:MAG: heparinase II/III family protein, partial [Gemmatimonadales bacterium]|nr:heparinase II/III family protein [Gemmatimonadales bacterium]
LLSVDGGICPHDGAALEFDPWSPGAHRCPSCGRVASGERHDRAWARFQHLWLAERTADLATLAVLTGDSACAERAAESLDAYAARYFEYPNRDNVLGPSRLFFSTYLESIWITGYLGAAALLREAGLLAGGTIEGVGAVAEEAANLIGEFDEGLSNRQTWHNAALAAIAVWFEDEELAGRAVEGPTGIIAHLVRGFGEDGLWYEGDNYHLFALRGQLLAMGWAAQAGVDILADPRLATRLGSALWAPAFTALPDHTFPARKDSRYGVSLAQPMYLELWEVGLARLGDEESALWGWLAELYRSDPPAPQRFDSYLHEAGEPEDRGRGRSALSWWALLEMAPALPPASLHAWQPTSALLDSQGLAILRDGRRYASLECGTYGGGHGHPDRLHLTLHADGVHWLPDPGTGSYVARDLFWYRSTLAHNAPRLDGASQPPGDARCLAFAEEGEWAWTRGSYGSFTRTIVRAPEYLLDVVEFGAEEAHLVELPWHPAGAVAVETAGDWSAAELTEEFVDEAERFEPSGGGPIVLRARAADGVELALHLLLDGELLRARAPGVPGGGGAATLLLARRQGKAARFLAALATGLRSRAVLGLRASGDLIEVELTDGVDRHVVGAEGWDVARGAVTTKLRGLRRLSETARPLVDLNRPVRVRGVATRLFEPPVLDGTAAGFDEGEPLMLDYEDQYRRSEEPYPGPDEFSASVLVAWGDAELYLSVEVLTPEPIFRAANAPPLRLDNEPDDIHSDGLQLYLRSGYRGPVYGFILVPDVEGDGVRVTRAAGTAGKPEMIRGAWRRTDAGYAVTVAVSVPDWDPAPGDELGFDLLVNRMEPGRERRTGQLVWSGGGGWVYLRGDRQDPGSFGILELR